jgi:hypothetical protein
VTGDGSAGNGAFDIQESHEQGNAALEATGEDRRSALEAALQATLRLLAGSSTTADPAEALQSAPVRGEGDDLGAVFIDLVADLFDQADYFGTGLHDVALDGLLMRDRGGYVAWGYVFAVPGVGSPLPESPFEVESVSVDEAPGRVTIRAELRRE